MYLNINPHTYYRDIDMVLFAMKPLWKVHLYLAPRPIFLKDTYKFDDLIKWEIGSVNRPELMESALMQMDDIISCGAWPNSDPDIVRRIDKLIVQNRNSDVQKENLYAAEHVSLYKSRRYPFEAKELASRIAADHGVDCPQMKWEPSKQGGQLDRYFLMRAEMRLPFLTPRLVENGYVTPAPLIGALIVDFMQAASFWERETRIKRAYYHTIDKDITFEANHALEYFVVHEMAHYILAQRQPGKIVPSHGAEFVRLYQEMLSEYISNQDKIGASKFAENAKKHDLLAEGFIMQFPQMHIENKTATRAYPVQVPVAATKPSPL